MGNYLNFPSDIKPSNKSLLKKLRRIRLEKVLEIFRDYVENVHPNETLDAEQFDNLFSPLLNNTTPFFNVFKEGSFVDIYQSFIALTIFSQGHFDDKIMACFVAFDIDGGGIIDRKELS